MIDIDTGTKRKMKKTGKIHSGPGHIRGYPGLVHTALQISEYIPTTIYYVEPFAGLGRTAKHSKAPKIFLNDKSTFACNYLTKNFPTATVTQHDFSKILITYDSPNTFFLIDPPWSLSEYTDGCRGSAYCDRTPADYYDTIFKYLKHLKSDWFLCGNKNNIKLKNPKYHHKLFSSKKKIMGGNISTLVMSNKQFKRHHQEVLT